MSFFLLLSKKNASQLFTEQFSCLHAFYFTTSLYFPPGEFPVHRAIYIIYLQCYLFQFLSSAVFLSLSFLHQDELCVALTLLPVGLRLICLLWHTTPVPSVGNAILDWLCWG